MHQFCNTGQNFTGVIHPPATCNPECSDEYLLPSVILWGPLSMYHSSLQGRAVLVCTTCSKELKVVCWNDGSSSHLQPRLIQYRRFYPASKCRLHMRGRAQNTCPRSKNTQQPTLQSMIPFTLIHKTGFTTNFINLCGSLCQSGMNFHSLEAVISHRRWEFFESRKQLYMFRCNQKTCKWTQVAIVFHHFNSQG